MKTQSNGHFSTARWPRSQLSAPSAPRAPPWCPLPGLAAAPAAWRAAAFDRGRYQPLAGHARPQGGHWAGSPTFPWSGLGPLRSLGRKQATMTQSRIMRTHPS
eukprot:scaffold93846_cov57-Phaeocystis_antarctica.AAC.2